MKGECAFCGLTAEVTDDHVPPKGLFPKPRPNNLITVPACSNCNTGRFGQVSRDDEYFRTMIALRDDVHNHPSIPRLFETIARSMQRPQGRGLRKKLMRAVHMRELRGRGGLIIGNRLAADVDMERINRVVGKIVRGLFYHRFRRCLPRTHTAYAVAAEHVNRGDRRFLKTLGELIHSVRVVGGIEQVGNREFEFGCVSPPEDADTTFWLLRFFGAVSFLGGTVQTSAIKADCAENAPDLWVPRSALSDD